MRNVAVIIGSKSDLPQCLDGLQFLQEAFKAGGIELYLGSVLISSIHRATDDTLNQLGSMSAYGDVDVLIAGAGWANHLTGVCDAYLRYGLEDDKIVVIGVAFEDQKYQGHTVAAVSSIVNVPGTQVVYQDDQGIFIGANGFTRACRFAIEGELPEIRIPEPRPQEWLSLAEAIERASM